jgi:hypothetical protein
MLGMTDAVLGMTNAVLGMTLVSSRHRSVERIADHLRELRR